MSHHQARASGARSSSSWTRGAGAALLTTTVLVGAPPVVHAADGRSAELVRTLKGSERLAPFEVSGVAVVQVRDLERTLAVNHLAPFLLTVLLLDRRKAGPDGRVVTVPSHAHDMGHVDFDDLRGEHDYSGTGRQHNAGSCPFFARGCAHPIKVLVGCP